MCVADLQAHGYDVFVVDTVAADKGVPHMIADLADFGQTLAPPRHRPAQCPNFVKPAALPGVNPGSRAFFRPRTPYFSNTR